MQIEVQHSLGEADAIRKLDTFFEELKQRQWPGGVGVTNARTSWNGNGMQFSFFVGKGGLGTDISGEISVRENRVVLNSELPMLARVFIGEDRIRDTIAGELRRVLSA